MTPESGLRARVERGATFLDQAEPRWWKRIERQLRLSSCSRCVLGQLFGGDEEAYERAVTTFVGPDEDEQTQADWTISHGFDVQYADFRSGYAIYDILDRLWLEAIEARRADPDRYVP